MRQRLSLLFKKPWVKTLGYVCFCTSALAAGTFTSWIGQSKMITTLGKQIITRTAPTQIFKEKDSLNVLLLGCDEERAPGGKKITVESARSDTMIVVKFNFKTNQLTGVSIPRDLMVNYPGYKSHKINAYHKIGGNELAKQVASHVLGVPIDRAVSINTHVFQEMVDMIGGIDINVEKKMKWTDRAGDLYIDLKPGFQHLDGYNTMCFVRYRHGDSDHHRQQRQKQFLLAFRDKIAKNLGLMPKIADKSKELIGDEFNMDEVASLVLFAARLGNENIKMGVIPTYQAGNYWLKVDQNKLDKTLAEFQLK